MTAWYSRGGSATEQRQATQRAFETDVISLEGACTSGVFALIDGLLGDGGKSNLIERPPPCRSEADVDAIAEDRVQKRREG